MLRISAGGFDFTARIEEDDAPETVAAKIAANMALLGASRFDMRYSMGRLPHAQMMRSIELYGTKVVPLVREMLA